MKPFGHVNDKDDIYNSDKEDDNVHSDVVADQNAKQLLNTIFHILSVHFTHTPTFTLLAYDR